MDEFYHNKTVMIILTFQSLYDYTRFWTMSQFPFKFFPIGLHSNHELCNTHTSSRW